MEGDIPLAVYSFELPAIKQGELWSLIRPDPFPAPVGTIFNFAGHRLRVLRVDCLTPDETPPDFIESAGFRAGDGLNVRQKLKRWLRQLGVNDDIIYLTLQPLQRESNEPLAT